jgi:hypothetical protein
MKKLFNAAFLLAFILLCCKKPYNPKVTSSAQSYLVVEGVINSGDQPTMIKLTYTVNLNSQATINPVLGASVTIESNEGDQFVLYDFNNGEYYSPPLGLSPSLQYRLRIITNGGNYVSDFIAVKPTPPIDSVGYVIQNGNLQLYVNTHDPANKTIFYRWDYIETWQFHAKYESDFIFDAYNNTIAPRNPDQAVYYCFGTDSSSNILLTSTGKLRQDIVYQSPLTTIPITSEKLETKYSILVNQYALTQEGYAFYENIQKNTEQLGSIFDSQPSQLNGNIHNINNPNEPVVGYISVTNVQSKRIFIPYTVLPPLTLPHYPYDCEEDTALYANGVGYNDVQNILINPPQNYVPTQAILDPFGNILGYKYSTAQCADCTARGTTYAPSFWK